MEIVEKKSNVDTNLVKELTTKFESLEQGFKDKKYMVELSKDLVEFYSEGFLNNITFKGYECYAIAELEKEMTSVFKAKTKALVKREHIEATFHFVKTFEGQGITMAVMFRDLCDAFAKPMQEIQTELQELKDVATELQAAEQGVDVDTLLKGGEDTTNGPS